MKSRRFPLLAGLLVLACAGTLHAAPSMDPFSSYWAWDQPQRKIEAKTIIEHSYYMDFQTKKFPDKPQQNMKLNLENGQVAAYVFILPDGTDQTETEIKFEAGRRSRIIHTVRTAIANQPPKVSINTETAAYDAKGQLAAITVERAGDPAIKVDIKTEATADGGKKLSWKLPLPAGRGPAPGGPATATSAPADNSISVSLTYDKSGNLIGRELQFPGRTMPSSTWKYNDKNDPVDVATGNTHDIYEYEYDAKGNWTKRTHTQVSHQPDGSDIKNVQDMVVRDITY